MKNNILPIFSTAIAALLGAPSLTGLSVAANLYWDGGTGNIGGNGNGIGSGNPLGTYTGTWDTTVMNWDTGAGSLYAAWNNSNRDTAVFSNVGGTGTVTIGAGGVTVGGLDFYSSSGYTIAANTNGLNFGAGNNTIRMVVGSAGSLVSAATITGTVGGIGSVILGGINPVGSSTLTINGSGSGGWSGSTTINAGSTLALGTTTANDAANRALASTTALNINGGGLTLNFATGASMNRVNDSAPVTFNGGGTVTIATALSALSEQLGNGVTIATGQANFVYNNNPSSGGSITLPSLTRSVNTAAATFSGNFTGGSNFAVTGATATPANGIIGAWATTGAQGGVAAQTDYAIFDASSQIRARNISASAESTWSTVHAATSNVTLANASGASASAVDGRLTATRRINTLRNTSAATTLTSVDTALDSITVTGSTYSNGDVVTFGGTAPGGLATGTAYYVINPSGATFQVAAASGGTAINLTNAGSSNVTGGITLSTGNNLGTFGILNGSSAALAIGASGTGSVTLPTAGAGNLFITPGSAGVIIHAPVIDNGGALTLVKSGSGNLILSGTNTHTGGTVVNAGTLTWTIAANMGASGSRNLTVNGAATLSGTGTTLDALAVNQGAAATVSGGALTFGTTSGAGNLVYFNSTGATTLAMGDAISFTGNVQSRIGGTSNANPTVSLTRIADTAGSFLQFAGGNTDSGQTSTFALTGNVGPLTFDNRQIAILPRASNNWGVGNSVLQNNNATAANVWVINTPLANFADRAGTLVLSGTNTGNNTFAGAIGDSVLGSFYNGSSNVDGVPALGVTKSGFGKWILSSANTFTGQTTIDAGTLRLENTLAVQNTSAIRLQTNATSLLSLGTDTAFASSTPVTMAFTGSTMQSDRLTPGAGLTHSFGQLTATHIFMNFTAGSNVTSGTAAIQFTNVICGSASGGSATFGPTTANLIITGGITGTATGTSTYTLDGTSQGNTIGGAITNGSRTTTNLTKTNNSTWVLSGTGSDYNGATTITAGTLAGIGANVFGNTTGISIAAASTATLSLRGDSSTSFQRAIDSVLYPVTTTAIGATINVDRATIAGTGARTMTIGTLLLNTAVINGTNFTGANNTSLSVGAVTTGNSANGTETLTNSINGGGSLTLASIAVNRTGTPTLAFAGDGNTTVTGAISEAAPTALTKSGTGILTLSGANTHTGTTTASGGKLLVNGSTPAAGLVTVSSTATLGGSGSTGAVTVGNGGTLAPGNSIESLGVASAGFDAGSTFAFEFQTDLFVGTPNVSADLVYSTGALSIAPGALLTLTDLGTSTALDFGSKLTLISYSGGTPSGVFTYGGSPLADGDIRTIGENTWRFDYDDTTGGSNYTAEQTGATRFFTMTMAVPEPGTAGLLALGLLLLRRLGGRASTC